MVSQVSLLGVTLHAYGLILGIALLVGLQLFERLLNTVSKKHTENELYLFLSVVIVASIVGARLWHVATDYWLYADNLWETLSIWNGGLSIFGGLLGGAIASMFVRRLWLKNVGVLVLLDCAALSISFGQSIGRWANYVNQELYGLPTQLPWGITIDAAHRLPGFEGSTTFHPLFLYESLALLLFGAWLWGRQKTHAIGSGYFLRSYVFFYAILRVLLDFLRIGVPRGFLMMSANQAVLVCVILLIVILQNVERTKVPKNETK